MSPLQSSGTAMVRKILAIASLLGWCENGVAQSSLTNEGAETGDTSSWWVASVTSVQEQNQKTGTVLPHDGNWFFSMAPAPASSAFMWQTNKLPSGVSRLFLSGVVQTENLAGDDYGEAVVDEKVRFLLVGADV